VLPDRVGQSAFYFESIAVANTSTTTCTMRGFPGLEVLDATGHVVATAGDGCVYMGCRRSDVLVTVHPGELASFALEWRSFPQYPAQQTCPQGVRLRITPPGAADHLDLATTVRACGVPPIVNVSRMAWGT
jgi:hypothetical protein